MLYSLVISLALCHTISAFSTLSSSRPLQKSFLSSKINEHRQQQHQQQSYSIIYRKSVTNLFSAETENSKIEPSSTSEEEWEYEEYEELRESDFFNSEWKVGTLMDGSNKIEETWTRLVVQEGEFICVWGDGSSGKWNFDAASQFLSMSKDSFGGWLGKRIWAGVIDDYYYVQGTIRGWSPISPASVVGQWQAKRLGVDKDEAGVAPWFEEEEEDDDEDEESKEEDEKKDGGLEASSSEAEKPPSSSS